MSYDKNKGPARTTLPPELFNSFLDHLLTWKPLQSMSAVEVESMLLAMAARGVMFGALSKAKWIEACSKVWDHLRRGDN